MTALLLLLALLGWFGLGTGVGVGTGSSETETSAVLCEPASIGDPCTGAELGIEYAVALQGHCEIEWAYMDGRFWVPASGHPESSGGMDAVVGLMELPAENQARFQGDGIDVSFVPAPRGYVPPPCA